MPGKFEFHPFIYHRSALDASVNKVSSSSFMKPRIFESLNPEPGESVLMKIEIAEQLEWLDEHMNEEYRAKPPVMVRLEPGESNTKYLDLYYETDLSGVYAQVSYITEPDSEIMDFWKVTANKMSPDKQSQMMEKYGINN